MDKCLHNPKNTSPQPNGVGIKLITKGTQQRLAKIFDNLICKTTDTVNSDPDNGKKSLAYHKTMKSHHFILHI